MRVVRVASPARRDMATVPALKPNPKNPKKAAIPASPAAMGWRMRMKVRLWIVVVSRCVSSVPNTVLLSEYPMVVDDPVKPKTPKETSWPSMEISRKEIRSHVGTETET